jgi:hypothetical protein
MACGNELLRGTVILPLPVWGLYDPNQEVANRPMLSQFTSSGFWDRKIRIGILVLATFIAMC